MTDEELLTLADDVGDTLLVDVAEILDVIVRECKDVAETHTEDVVDSDDMLVLLGDTEEKRVPDPVAEAVKEALIVEVAEDEGDAVFKGVADDVVDIEIVAVTLEVVDDETDSELDDVPWRILAVAENDCKPGEAEVENVTIVEPD